MRQWSMGTGRAYRGQERPQATQRGHMGAITPKGVGRAGNRSPAKGGRFHRPGPSSFPGCCCCRHVGGRPVRLLGVSEGQPCHFGSHERPTAATSGPERPEQGRGLAPRPKRAGKGLPGRARGAGDPPGHRQRVGVGGVAPMSLSIHQNLFTLWGLQKAPRRAMVKLLHQYQTAPGGATRRRASLAQKQGYHKML